MKKVLIVSTVGLIYDGITSVILSYLQAMNLDGLDIYVAGTIDVKPSIRKHIEECGCKIIDFPNRRTNTGKYFLALSLFIKRNSIEVIHAHGNSGTLAIEMVAAWLGGCKKRIAHSHNTQCEQVKADKLLRPIFNRFYTEGLACGYAAGKWLFGDRMFKILSNGRDIRKYIFNQEKRKVIRTSLGIKDEIVIGHVGGFYEQKNHTFLVEIYRELRMLEPTCKLFMIGDGPLKDDIEKKCDGLDVSFTGTIDDVSGYLNAMDGMILPSLFEGVPLVAVEWQINGLPALMSDSITRECILTNNARMISLKATPKFWAEQMLVMIKENDRIISSKSACEFIKTTNYNIENNAEILKKIYIG